MTLPAEAAALSLPVTASHSLPPAPTPASTASCRLQVSSASASGSGSSAGGTTSTGTSTRSGGRGARSGTFSSMASSSKAPSRIDSTRSTAISSLGSEAGETDAEGSVLSGSAGGSSSLGRSTSSASTAPTSPGIHAHKDMAALLQVEQPKLVLDRSLCIPPTPDDANASSHSSSSSTYTGGASSASPASAQQPLPSPRAQGYKLAESATSKKARRGSLPSITTSASAATVQLGLTAKSSITVEGDEGQDASRRRSVQDNNPRQGSSIPVPRSPGGNNTADSPLSPTPSLASALAIYASAPMDELADAGESKLETRPTPTSNGSDSQPAPAPPARHSIPVVALRRPKTSPSHVDKPSAETGLGLSFGPDPSSLLRVEPGLKPSASAISSRRNSGFEMKCAASNASASTSTSLSTSAESSHSGKKSSRSRKYDKERLDAKPLPPGPPAQQAPSKFGFTSGTALGVWHAATIGDPDDRSHSGHNSASSSRQHLPRTASLTVVSQASSPSGRMSSLGRRLSSVFDHPPRFKNRSSLPGLSRSRSQTHSAAPSEPGSPETPIAFLVNQLSASPKLSSSSRPSSSMGFIRSTLNLTRKSSSGTSAEGPKMLQNEAKLTVNRHPAPLPPSKSYGSRIPVSALSFEPLHPKPSPRSPRVESQQKEALATVKSPKSRTASTQSPMSAPTSPQTGSSPGRRGRPSLPGAVVPVNRPGSVSADALTSPRTVASNVVSSNNAAPARAQPASSLALAELDGSIEAAAAKLTTGVGADVWAKEVRALFVVREIIQTERSYAKHLEALIGAVRKTALHAQTSASSGKHSSGGGGGGGPAPHLATMKTILPPMIVLSRSLAARMEQNPTSGGVGAAFTLLQEQIEANFVAWSRAVGTIMDALRVHESGKGKSKHRIGYVAPSPLGLGSPLTSSHGHGGGGVGGARAPSRSANLDALALTRPSSPVLGVGSDDGEDPASYPIWATADPAYVAELRSPALGRRRSSTLSSLGSPPLLPKEVSPLSKSPKVGKRPMSSMELYRTGADPRTRRLSSTHDDLRALDSTRWALPGEVSELNATSATGKGKLGKKKPVTSIGGVKLFEPQDIVIMPTQRVVRYILLLKDLLANTPAGGQAYARVERALELVSLVAEQCNKAARPMGQSGSAAATAATQTGSSTQPTPLTSPTTSSKSSTAPESTILVSPTRRAGPNEELTPTSSDFDKADTSTSSVPSSYKAEAAASMLRQNRRHSFANTVQAVPRTLKKVAR